MSSEGIWKYTIVGMDNTIQIIVYKYAREWEYSCNTVLNPCWEEKEEAQVEEPEYPERDLNQRTLSGFLS